VSLKSCRGLEDLLPAELATWQHVEAIARETAQSYGYREIRTPLIEPAELFAKVRGTDNEVTRREQVIVRDRGGRAVVVRP
jgi:histidyl-tRNA synthetase